MSKEDKKNKGYIKFYRNILESDLWNRTTTEQYKIANFILLSANYKSKEIELKNGKKMLLKPGQFLTTVSFIQKGVDSKGKWATEKTIKCALDKLQKIGFLRKETIKSVPKFWSEIYKKGDLLNQNKGSSKSKYGLYSDKCRAVQCTLITVENWAFYQGEIEKGDLLIEKKGFSQEKEGLYLEQKGDINKECIINNNIIQDSNKGKVGFEKLNNNVNSNNKNYKSEKSIENSLEDINEILKYLNERSKKNLPNVEINRNLILERLKEGYTMEDFKKVIDYKTLEWLDAEWYNNQGKLVRGKEYLHPSTLFSSKNFDKYLNQANSNEEIPKKESMEKEFKPLTLEDIKILNKNLF